MKEKVKFYPEKQGVSVRGSEWTLWIRKVKTKDEGKDIYVVKPLKVVYDHSKLDSEEGAFSYEEMARPVWLEPWQFGKLREALEEM